MFSLVKALLRRKGRSYCAMWPSLHSTRSYEYKEGLFTEDFLLLLKLRCSRWTVNLFATAVNLAFSGAYVEVQVSHQDGPVARYRMEARRAAAIVSQPNGGISELWGRIRWNIRLEYVWSKQSHLCQTSFPKGTLTVVLLASKRGWVTGALGSAIEGFSCRAAAEWGRKL